MIHIIINLPIFVFAVIACFYLPGKLLSEKLNLKLPPLEDLFFSTIFGLVFFTLISVAFSWFKLQPLIVVATILLDIVAIKKQVWKKIRLDKQDVKPLLVIIVLAAIFSLPMITSGYFGNTLRLLGENNHDGLWHLALINELRVNFPPQHPGFPTSLLTGYHIFYFLLVAVFSNIFHIDIVTLHFQFFSPLIAILWAVGVYVLMKMWTKNRTVSLFAVFLTMFGGNFVFVSWLHGHTSLSLDSGYGILQPAVSLINPSTSSSIPVLLGFLVSLFAYLDTKKNTWLIPIAIFAGMIAMFKVYAGIVVLAGFGLFFLYNLAKKNFVILLSAGAVGLLLLTTYWPFTDRSAHLLWAPLWGPHTVLLDNMPWYRYDEKMYTYTKLHVIRGILETEGFGLMIFILGNLGSRIIGLLLLPLTYFKNKKLPSVFATITFCMMLVGILIPLFFLQTGKVFEIIQMAAYYLFLVSLFSALGLSLIFNKKVNKFIQVVLAIIIIALTLPSSILNMKYYATSKEGYITDPRYFAASTIKNMGTYKDTVLELPGKGISTSDNDLMYWYKNSDPSMIVYADKRVYLTNEFQDYSHLDVKSRLDFIKSIMNYEKRKPPVDTVVQLKSKGIVYIYSPYKLAKIGRLTGVKNIYNKDGAYIYQIQ